MNWLDRLIMKKSKPLSMQGKGTGSKLVPWKYQTFGLRVGAGLIDGMVLMPLSALFAFLLRDSSNLPPFLFLLFYTINCSAFLVYSILLHGMYGQTIGKMVMKIKVLTLNESPLGMKRAILRVIVPICLTLVELVLEMPTILKNGSMGELVE